MQDGWSIATAREDVIEMPSKTVKVCILIAAMNGFEINGKRLKVEVKKAKGEVQFKALGGGSSEDRPPGKKKKSTDLAASMKCVWYTM